MRVEGEAYRVKQSRVRVFLSRAARGSTFGKVTCGPASRLLYIPCKVTDPRYQLELYLFRAIHNLPFSQIIRRHFGKHPVAGDNLDAMTSA